MLLDNSLIVKQVEELAVVLKPWSDQLVLGGGVALILFIEKNHESWAKTFRNNIKNWIENASPKDWDMLASQDINSILNENNFKQALQELLKKSTTI